VPDEVMRPKQTWQDKAGYDQKARDLAARFRKNFTKYEGTVEPEVLRVSPTGGE
jgi:phosphoenolpyruvate carboxykinase (ATP)